MQVIAKVTSHPVSCCRSSVQCKVPLWFLTLCLTHPPPPKHTHTLSCMDVIYKKDTLALCGLVLFSKILKKKKVEKKK